MSQMLPEGAEVMRRAACGDVCPAPPPAPLPPAPLTSSPAPARSENKELLRQQLLSASKERLNAEKPEPPKKHARSRQKNRWKLKFHHQALPQEYLDHYEQSLQRASAKPAPPKLAKPEKLKREPSGDGDALADETFKIWAQRLAATPPGPPASATPPGPPAPAAPPKPAVRPEDRKKRSPAIAPSKIVTYDDLPYMGEMTLNDAKPRRGRKPKKADICHLIYENYGTVVPGRPAPGRPAPAPRTDLQNRLISSLLERKLSQESRRRPVTSPDEPMPAAPPTLAGPLHSDDEPLNLCIRDLHDLKIQIRKKFGNIYASPPEVKSEEEQPNAISVIQRNTNPPATARSSPDLGRRAPVSPALSEPARAGACWAPAGAYLHPLALQAQLLCYQRLAAAARLPFVADRAASTPPSVADSGSTDASAVDDSKNKLVLKQISELLDPRVVERAEARRSPERKAARGVKRKRSAIFIPPVPPRTSSAAPTAEVSICKFKFTGGSKPSLQEKKMLSVDSGGNFRYYSGTGGKGAKGYEYMQRDAAPRRPPSPPPAPDDASKKKRKSRKSLQREKLEQTFKEKGFLIQTQQRQSAEGATYCKFRQLRKFTRYLFRSWKDYLPGELDAAPGPADEWG